MKKNFYKFNKFYNYLFGEKFYKCLKFNWDNLPKKHELINLTIKKKKFKSYLEIGCDQNYNFNLIEISKKIGVDPISGGNIRMTSDDFFKSNFKKFDCIFIDGLHTYEQVKKDIENSLKFLNPEGVIFIHDCLPKSFFHQTALRSRNVWNGDVWKSIVEFRTISSLDTCTCFIDHGLGIILKRPNKNILKIKFNNFKKLKFKYFYYNHNELMNIIPYDKVNIFLEF